MLKVETKMAALLYPPSQQASTCVHLRPCQLPSRPGPPEEPASDPGPGKAPVVPKPALDWRPDRTAYVCQWDSLLALPRSPEGAWLSH